MSYIRTWALTGLLALSACGSQARTHAAALQVTHAFIDETGHTIDESCALAVERASTLVRAEEIAAGCTRAAIAQNGLVHAWAVWARATLQKLADGDFDFDTAMRFARSLRDAYVAMADDLAGLGVRVPPLPRVLEALLGSGVPEIGGSR